jgi:Domain of unknown function (DUF4440)
VSRNVMRSSTLAIVAVSLCASAALAQPVRAVVARDPSSLRAEILQADSLMFAAYNAHDAVQIGRYFTRDLEFYHDAGGLLTWAQAMAGLTSNFDQNNGIRRVLVGAVEVYPIRDYGAIETGVHQFCHREADKEECGTFKFLHVWRRTAAGWQVSRAVSYDH